ncbi:MAG: GGDEF domain-containing protein [Bacillota bacterium]
MKEKMYEHAPIILLVGGLILWLNVLLIDRNFNHYQGMAWMSFGAFMVIINVMCGILIKKLHEQVHIDPLTGLHNRNYFYAKMSELKSNSFGSLILIDIDNFKSINDTFGHIAGDQVLQQFAEILQKNTRGKDIITRWGGEEFAVILLQSDAEEAFKTANRIRRVVENHIFSCESTNCKITVSIGIASAEEADIGIDQLLKIADEALYLAKEKKNSIVTVSERVSLEESVLLS